MHRFRLFALLLILASCGSTPDTVSTTAPTTSVPTTQASTTSPTTTTEPAPTTVASTSTVYAFENLEHTWWPANLYVVVQDMTPWGGGTEWEGQSQLFVGALDTDPWIEFTFTVGADGPYQLDLQLTRAPDFGIVQVSIDGMPIDDIDLYFAEVLPTRVISLGPVALVAGVHTIRFTAVGKSDLSTSMKFGLDTITVNGPVPECCP